MPKEILVRLMKPFGGDRSELIVMHPRIKGSERKQCARYINADALIEWLEGQRKDEETPVTINEARLRYGHNDCIDTILNHVRGK